MRAVLIVVVLLAVPVGVALLARRRRPPASPQAQPQTTERTPHEMPEPGEPSARRHGQPVPGSRADRARHGQP